MNRLLLVATLAPTLLLTPACNKLASRNRVNAIHRLNQAVELHKKQNSGGAEKALQEAIQADPTFAEAHFTLGQVYRKSGKLKDAEKAFQGAIDNMAEAPKSDYWYQMGSVIAQQGEADGVSATDQAGLFGRAINAFQEAIKMQPTHYKAYYRMGTLHEKLDQPQQADAAFRKAIEVRPNYSPSFVNLGNMYIEYGFPEVGEQVLQAGVATNDKDAKMWNGLGRAYQTMERPQQAVEAFTKAKAIDPDMPDVLFGLGMAYADLRKRAEAVENLNAFLQKAGADVPEHQKKAANDAVARMNDVI